jgi:cytochrome d ubiquinol oxidase subunit II
MDLNILWFSIIAVVFIGFFFLEGFDYGVGILMPFIGKNEAERRTVISAIGPFWDGNEVWMIVAAGAMFAAFPEWYATLFSGFYPVMMLMLVTLILRGVAFEFRNRDSRRGWRNFWDAMIFIGSFTPALLWGIVLTNLIKGLPIDAKKHYVGTLLDILNPYALVGGLTFVALFMLHGAIFLNLKTEGKIMERAHKAMGRVWFPAALLVCAFGVITLLSSDVLARLDIKPAITFAVTGLALLAAGGFIKARRSGWAFVMSGLAITLATLTLFVGLFPRVMVSSLNPDWSLTIYNASANSYSLGIVSWLALTLIPVVIGYQAWNYWVFRKRVSYNSSHHL